jgi:hypothetical protein
MLLCLLLPESTVIIIINLFLEIFGQVLVRKFDFCSDNFCLWAN